LLLQIESNIKSSDLVHLPKWTFDRKRIQRYFCQHNPNLNPIPNSSRNLNPKAKKRFRENKMTLFFGQVSRYPKVQI